MPLQLPLPERLSNEGWKVKIYDNERLEPPHATVIRGNLAWRLNLRSRQFMDREPDPRDVPRELRDVLQVEHAELVRLWDRTHPGNPVTVAEDWL
jgi:hypothetical protein